MSQQTNGAHNSGDEYDDVGGSGDGDDGDVGNDHNNEGRTKTSSHWPAYLTSRESLKNKNINKLILTSIMNEKG